MSNYAEILIAKYIADPKRMEPRNLGVILLVDDEGYSKFIGENESGVIDTKPRFIFRKNFPVYQDWVEYWNSKINSPKFSGKLREELTRSRSENYAIVDAGNVMNKIGSPELTLNDLFEQLVHANSIVDDREQQPSNILKRNADQFFETTKVSSHPNFHEKFTIRESIHGVQNALPFSYGIGISGELQGIFEDPKAVFQLTNPQQPKEFQSTVLKLGTASKKIDKNRCASIICVDHAELKNWRVDDACRTLEKVGVVINLANTDEAQDAIESMELSLSS